ncbi:AEC family transporter [Actinoplanes sp. NPDC051859]|uniref:AEC family transporter n=1 Tax=Actinoplanes sp. NPDC051859 TaxID=3363909 RepID=UPI0037A1EF06
MISALSGFALIGAIVLAGWCVGRWRVLPGGAEPVLGRLVYAVLTPCLLFTVVADADLHVLLSEPLLASAAAAFTCFGLFALIFRRLDRGTTVLGALSGGYVNANYIGIPVATYVLGDAALVVPIVMLQLLLVTPVALTLLEITTTGRSSVRTTLTTPLRNPLIVAVLLGLLGNTTGVELPAVLAEPVATIGSAAVPVVLIAFGMSLVGRRVLEPGTDRVATVAAVALKTVVMPLLAYGTAILFGLPRSETYAVVVLAALPTAQHIFLYAQRFRTAELLVRDTIFLSTLAAIPVLLLIAVLFTR